MYQPVRGARISSPYLGGFRSSGGHSGVDFAAPAGSLIYAAVPGTVISAGRGGAYGNLVKVRHQDGSIGYYAHMSGMSVRPGQRVGRGSILGRVGNTGNVSGRNGGYHLHFEVRQNGKPVNPMGWLDRNYSAQAATSNQSMSPGVYGGVRLNAEQLRNAQTIISVGRQMGASDRDLIIGLMTAMQESTLRNLNYGDRDSLGLFQQRPSAGWGSPSQVRNPTYASRKFFENLLRIKGRNGMSLTQAAQAVQRSAFPNAYAKWEQLAKAIMGNPNAGVIPLGDQFFTETVQQYRDPSEIFGALAFDQRGLTPTPENPATSPTEFDNPGESFVPEDAELDELEELASGI